MSREIFGGRGFCDGPRLVGWRSSLRFCLIAGVFAVLAAANARANPSSPQPSAAKAVSLGTPEQKVDGTWQFRPGDSPPMADAKAPLWADPSFDDSKWKQVQADTLGNQNLPYTQFAWYRRRVAITRQHATQTLALLVHAANTYDVYWNGQLLGTLGDVPPRFNWPFFTLKAFALPLPEQPSVTGLLAVRVWCQYPSSIPDDCGFLSPPVIGDAAQLESRSEARHKSILASDFLFLAVVVLGLLAALAALLVYLHGQRDLLYLWFAILLLGAAGNEFSGAWTNAQNWSFLLPALTIGILNAGFLLLILWLFHLQHDRRLRHIVIAVAMLIAAVNTFDGILGLFWAAAQKGMQRADAVSTVFIMLFTLAPLALLGFAVSQKGAKRDWPVIVTGGAFFLCSALVNFTGQWPNLIHWHMDWVNRFHSVGYFDYNLSLILLVLLLLALGMSVFRHFLAERRRQERGARELLAAREVQQVLVPEQVPPIPGFAVGSVYRPASEVGGDFFQIFSTKDGGVLVVIGDVSGKGLKAAMIVSLIVGTLRTVATFTQEPAEILKQLNERLHGRMSGGFVTCLVLRIDGDSSILAAHAGHISPYIGGQEFALAGSVPLGIVPGMEYEQEPLRVLEGETLTLLTDGVPEAQNGKRDLFGFARLAALLATHPTAEKVVEAACTFGQQDDITVLTLTRLADKAAVGAVSMALTPQDA